MTTDREHLLMLTWHEHRRTRQLCRELEIPLTVLNTESTGVGRYWSLISQTVRELRVLKPEVLIIQNPSIVLAFFCSLTKRIFGFRLAVDAHNEAIDPVVYDYLPIRLIGRLVIYLSDYTIVTNSSLADQVTDRGGRPLILPDAIPEFPKQQPRIPDNGDTYVLVISTVAPDEPLDVVLDSARQLDDVRFVVTGNKQRFLERYGPDIPDNVRLSGFVPDEKYWQLISDATVVVDLSTMADCLVCGSYEAVAVERPLILTRNRATEEVYSESAILVENDPDELSAAIINALQNNEEWSRRMKEFRRSYSKRWRELADGVLQHFAPIGER